MPGIVDKLLQRFLRKDFISDEQAFKAGMERFIQAHAEHPAFKEGYPQYDSNQPPHAIDLASDAVIEKLSSWWNIPADQVTAKACFQQIADLSKVNHSQIFAMPAPQIKNLASIIRELCTVSLAQRHMIKGANQYIEREQLQVEKLNEEGVCSELSGAWLDAMMSPDHRDITRFYQIVRKLSQYSQAPNVLLSPEEKEEIELLIKTKISGASSANHSNVEQVNYRRIRSMIHENSYSVVAKGSDELGRLLAQIIDMQEEAGVQKNKAFRIAANGHTVTVLKKDNKLYFFDSNNPTEELNHNLSINLVAEKLFNSLENEQKTVCFSVHTYPLDINQQNPHQSDENTFFDAAFNAIAKINQANFNYIAKQYKKGAISQRVFLDKIFNCHVQFKLDFSQPQETKESWDIFSEQSQLFQGLQKPPILRFKKTKIPADARLQILKIAAREGDYLKVKSLLKNKIKFEDLKTLLELAVMNGHIDVAHFLLEKISGGNTLEDNGVSLLIISLHFERPEMALYLITQGCFSSSEQLNAGILESAVKNGYLQAVKQLMDKCVELKKPEHVLSSINQAAVHLQPDILAHLLANLPLDPDTLSQILLAVVKEAKRKNIDPAFDEQLIATVNVLMTAGAKISFIQGGKNIFHLAAEAGHLGLIKHLYQKKPSALVQDEEQLLYPELSALDNEENNLLHLAAKHGQPHVVDFLLSDKNTDKFDLTAKNHQGKTALHLAASAGSDESVTFLLKKQPELLEDLDADGHSALYLAAQNGHLGVIRSCGEIPLDSPLLRQPANDWPLHVAIRNNRLLVITDLLQNHYPGLTDNEISGLLHHAIENKASTSVSLIISILIDQKREKDVPLRISKALAHEPAISFTKLFDNLDDASLRIIFSYLKHSLNDKEIRDLLRHAIENKASSSVSSIISILIDQKRQKDIPRLISKALAHEPAISFTKLFDNLDDASLSIISSYLGHSLVDNNKSTFLHHACRKGYIRTIETLISRRADIDAKNNQGDTPLLVALKKDQKCRAVPTLLNHAADITIVNKSGHNALFYATEYRGEVAVTAISNGKVVNITTLLQQANTEKARSKGTSLVAKSSVSYTSGALLCALGGACWLSMVVAPNPISLAVGTLLIGLGTSIIAVTKLANLVKSCFQDRTEVNESPKEPSNSGTYRQCGGRLGGEFIPQQPLPENIPKLENTTASATIVIPGSDYQPPANYSSPNPDDGYQPITVSLHNFGVK